MRRTKADRVAYLDADMAALGELDGLDNALGSGSIFIVPHDYSLDYLGRESAPGKFNVGLLIFRSDRLAEICLEWWRDRCVEWCYNRKEDGKCGDQGYLNDWPERFEGVVVSSHPGIGLAPWNVRKYPLNQSGGRLLCPDGQNAVFYHFHAVKFCTRRLAWLGRWNLTLDRGTLELAYRPYVNELAGLESTLAARGVPLKIPRVGFPWRYLAGRIVRRQPVRYFMWASRSSRAQK
jgi:hypothetical protein